MSQVKIVNATPQLISTAVLKDGVLVELKLAGRASVTVESEEVSEHVHQLVAQQRLKLRPV